MSEDMNEIKKNLENKLWKTRKARINQSDKLMKLDKSIKTLLVLFTIELLIFNFVEINFLNCSSNMIIFLTIIISGFSIFFASSNLVSEALMIKNIYIQMDNLIFELKNADEKKVIEIQKRYHDLLTLCDNHSELDYLYSMKQIYLRDKIKERDRIKNMGKEEKEEDNSITNEWVNDYENLSCIEKNKVRLYGIYYFSSISITFFWFVILNIFIYFLGNII